MAKSNFHIFASEAGRILPKERIYTDDIRRLAWGTDAGFYRLVPKLVVRVENEREVSELLALATKLCVPVTFRAAGTSLSGQASTDSVLIIASHGWENFEIGENAETITLQPGIRGARVNEILHPYGKTFSPDPASKAAAMVGGIVMNNASGMNCGTHANSDKILVGMRIVLSNGTVIDTSKEGESKRERVLLAELAAIRDEILADRELVARIRKKYSIKNVMGLNLLPFVEYSDPREILAHVMVGSEGTLAFMSQVTVKTARLLPLTASAMAYFSDIKEACRAVVAIRKSLPEVFSCELLDKKSLSSVNDGTGDGLTALLIETRAETEDTLAENIHKIEVLLDGFNLFRKASFSSDPAECSALWKMRSGVFPAVGGTRRPGTTSLIEDVAFHIDDLPQATADLARLIEDCGYEDSCIYGHALEGNYHFVIAQSFDSSEEVEKYSHLIDSLADLVVDRYDGSLKAEHGTGRNMAPFVKREWGSKAFEFMCRIKKAFDPDGILGKGVIFNDDPKCHISGFKPLPLVDPIIDKCIECGFCEAGCVSCGLTFSPRQRIVVRREIARLRGLSEAADGTHLKALEKGYRYLGEKTCAADGLCRLACPMGICTGDLTHKLRGESLGNVAHTAGKVAADRFPAVKGGLRLILGAASLAHKLLGDKAVEKTGRMIHKLGLPLWTPSLPGPFRLHSAEASVSVSARKVVYFPSCINQTMGASQANGHETLPPLVEVMTKLCKKAGFEVIFPENMNRLCCGMVWESKGMEDVADRKTAELEDALRKASDNGQIPILCDQSPCLHRMRKKISDLKLYEPAEFILDFLAPHLEFHPVDDPIAIHLTCSTRLMGVDCKMIELARKCSTNVLVPEEVGCCGFAGDKGFTTPELNEWGLRKLRSQVVASGAEAGYSNSRTCEIGLATHSGIPYQSIAYLVDKVTR